eukprot:TRINITY_DN3225_c1_g1_i1.p1 TRINITY_DN3225_c1_g1~~TRINITY_DN3225_c1_g1_i1.p1  ORF type:complete len:348 (+),score=60.43 TRINITY_DN3225_c1_g1_i1:45-1046(+)
MLNDLLPDYSDSESELEIEGGVEKSHQKGLQDVPIIFTDDLVLGGMLEIDDSSDVCIPITPFSSPRGRNDGDGDDYEISPLTVRTELGDGLSARACGFGSYDHNGGFEVFDSPVPTTSFQRGISPYSDNARYELLYADAFRRNKRLKAKQAMKAIRTATEEERIITKNKPTKLPAKKVDFICNKLTSTVGRDRRIKELTEEREKALMKDCTFHPQVNALENSKYYHFVSGSSCRSSSRSRSLTGRSLSAGRRVFSEGQSKRLHDEASNRAKTRDEKIAEALKRERRQRELDKQKANPAYAARVRKKAEKRALEKKIFEMMKIAEERNVVLPTQ